MTIGPPPLCWSCKRYNATPMGLHTCEAFPDGIPEEILNWTFDHHNPHPGDGGKQFVPSEEKA